MITVMRWSLYMPAARPGPRPGRGIISAMRTLIVLILSGWWGVAASAELSEVKKVYLFPMTGGLEQYLAERLTAGGVFQVVVDPKQADAVWSERLDEGFRAALEELNPPAKPAQAKEKEKEKAADVGSLKEPPARQIGRAHV